MIQFLPMLAMGAMSAGGALLSGMGAKQASAKQGRMQMIADELARQANERTLNAANARREQLGNELIAMSDPRVAVAEAEAAGYNPVTWLSAGYGSRVGALSDAFRMMTPEYSLSQASQIPQQHSMLSAFGGALSAAGSAMGTQYRADQSYDLQMGKLAMGLSNSFGFGGAASSTNNWGGGISYGTTMNGGGAAGGSGTMSAVSWPGVNSWGGMSLPKGVEDKKPEMIPLGMFGWKQDPRFPQGQTVEDIYTELGSWPYSVFKLANDFSLNQFGVPAPGNVVLGLAPSGASRSATEKAFNQAMSERGFMIPGGWWNQWFNTAQ